MRKFISIFATTCFAAILVYGCNNSSTGNASSDTTTHVDSFNPPAVTEGGIKDTTMHGFDSTRSKDSAH